MGARRELRRIFITSPLGRLVEPRFVVIGVGRSGTKYISDRLTQAGIRTGHETWWGTDPKNRYALRLKGDASWLAVFNLDGYRGRIFHQIRDPIRIVASLAGTSHNPEWQNQQTHQGPYLAHRARYVPLTGSAVVDAMNVTATYLDECERVAEWTWRLEDVDQAIIDRIAHAAGTKARPVPLDMIVNTRPHAGLDWDDLPAGETKDRLLIHAEKYGYL